MTIRIGCLHAHYSNIEYIEQALSGREAELLHFVDPALVYRISSDENFSLAEAGRRVKEQIEWIEHAGVDAILVTCTNYIAVMQDDPFTASVPIMKIDEPFFADICRYDEPQLLLFTNPATVDGTMKRLREYARMNGHKPDVEALVIEGVFELIMKGNKDEHNRELSDRLRRLVGVGEGKSISVGQLSMSEAAGRVAAESGVPIGNPLESLISSMDTLLWHETA
ncbi:aspartate/glutamate racemase family protein [Cohnella terricola]|uniref:Asp/Glu/hydantoin racemase n=1 Tax=Cohnella terricola TaxID=1289167 RepID=A0A559JIN6_9BACL|nr:aspartate/glutamate racemase family protein [Cohnella terricola]TVX99734.1 hypothetical protein FPZ45_12330 [Cohnella terricola]